MKRIKEKLMVLWMKVKHNFIVVGILSLIWLLFRSGTKPSRLQYPCQKAAASNVGLLFLFLPYHFLHKLHWKIKKYFKWSDLIKVVLIVGISLASAIGFEYLIKQYDSYRIKKEFQRTSVLGPIGKKLSTGLFSVIPPAMNIPSPQRVVSVHSSAATSWPESDSSSRYANTVNTMNQVEINRMVERGVMELTGEANPHDAWANLIPYTVGEAVAVKLNFNNVSSTSRMNPYPHLINAIIDGLKSIGVPSDMIWLADPSRPIRDGISVINTFKDNITDKNLRYVGQGDEDYVNDNSPDATTSVMYNGTEIPINPSLVFAGAAHIINVPQLKGHGGANITLGLKNHFGSISITKDSSGSNSNPPTHSYFYGYSDITRVNLLADISDNPVFKNKTRLIVGSGLMGHPTANWSAPVVWNTFGNKPPEILFFGVDPVATDSVMFDYLQAEAGNRSDAILHYAANIGLGVHENWNNATDKQYSAIDYVEIELDAAGSDPQASFTASTQRGIAPLTIDFDASNSVDPQGTITNYNWDFGDGTTGSGVQVSHTFNTMGDYTVQLTVLTDQGTQDQTQMTITVLEEFAISQHGIIWTFDKEYECGQFANGDWWVIGPVVIESISPESFLGDGIRTQTGGTWIVNSGRIVNGSMVNPDPNERYIGYDSTCTSFGYNENLNAARKNNSPISPSNSLDLPVNSSLISMISLDHNHPEFGASQGYLFKSAAILTVLETSAPADSFRPSYCGSDKTVKFNENQINYDKLKNLDKKDFCDYTDLVMNNPDDPQASSAERMVARPWIDHLGGGMGDVLAPIENMIAYPGYRNGQIQEIAMFLNVDWTGSPGFVTNNQYKRKLLISTIQLGIDCFGIYQAGATNHWKGAGGHGVSRKWPIIFAGALLEGGGAHSDASAMANIGLNSPDDPFFSEDHQTFYVNQKVLDAQNATYDNWYAGARGWADPGSTQFFFDDPDSGLGGVCANARDGNVYPCLGSCGPDPRDRFDIPYMQADVDNQLPEFAIWGTDERIFMANRAWGTYYRRGQTTPHWFGLALSVLVMDLKDKWNHEPFFDYLDRYIAIEKQIRAKIVAGGGGSWYAGHIGWPEITPVEHTINGTPEFDVHGNPVQELFGRHYVCSSEFVENMWNTYRADYGAIWPEKDPEDPEPPNNEKPQDPIDPTNPTDPSTEPSAEPIPETFNLIIQNNVLKTSSNSRATIICDLKEAGILKVVVYDAKGREVKVLCNEYREAQRYTDITWNATDESGNAVGSGIYMVHMESGGYKETKKIAVIR